MKKFVALSLVLMMALALCACGNKVEQQTWKFACSATDNTCWADMGRDFGKMISEATDGAITVQVYAADQLTAGNQTEGIQGVIDGTIDLSAHSNIIYANFDQRLNVVSMPFLFDSYEDVDAKLTGEAGAAVGKVVESQGLKLLGVLPQDESVYEADCESEPSSKLPENNPVKVALHGILQSIGL